MTKHNTDELQLYKEVTVPILGHPFYHSLPEYTTETQLMTVVLFLEPTCIMLIKLPVFPLVG